jgi:hypothetical protein
MLSALAGAFVMAVGPAALAATPATSSPEGIVLSATGPLAASVGVATLGTSPVSPSGGGITGLLDISGVLTATAQNTSSPAGNSATASVATLGPSTSLLSPLLGSLISATVVASSCQWNSTIGTGDAAFTETTDIASLSVLGTTVPVADLSDIPPNTNLASLITLPSLPLGISALTITLNQQEAGPGTNTETVNAIDVTLTSSILGLVGSESIDVSSSTCGAPTSVVASPVASGKGLGIGLGLLGLVGAGLGAVYVRRRRVALAA